MQSGTVKGFILLSLHQLGVRESRRALKEYQVRYQTATGATVGKCPGFVRKVQGRGTRTVRE